jgi:hypothetical protein
VFVGTVGQIVADDLTPTQETKRKKKKEKRNDIGVKRS